MAATKKQGMATAESMWGERFVLDGDPKFYVGTFNQWQGSQQISPGGFELHADGIMVASKPQFGTVKPRYGQRLTIGPRRYIAVEVHEDIASWDLVLKGTDE